MSQASEVSPLEAAERVARYVGGCPELPLVVGGGLGDHGMRIVFDGPAELPAPFRLLESGPEWSVWLLPLVDARLLPAEGPLGPQMQELTAVGVDDTGAQMLLSLRDAVIGVTGSQEFVDGVMVGLVMEQAAEPWTRAQHIWLVGYGELAPQLVSYLAPFHARDRFHAADSLDEIRPEDLEGMRVTFYVRGSDSTTLQRFEELRNGAVGLVTDSVVSADAPSIEELDDDGLPLRLRGRVALFRHLLEDGALFAPRHVGEDAPQRQAMLRAAEAPDSAAEEAVEEAEPAPGQDDGLSEENPPHQHDAVVDPDDVPESSERPDSLRAAVMAGGVNATPQATRPSGNRLVRAMRGWRPRS